MRILIDSGLLADACGKDLAALKNHLSQYAFNLMYSSRKEDAVTFQVQDLDVQSSFDFLKNKKAYLFVSYEKLSAKNGKIEGIRDFVKHTRNMISEHYKEALVAKSA